MRDIKTVLSLFDGMSGGQQTLVNTGIEYNKYYASEVDKYAISITMKNFPNTIQLGSVVDVKGKDLDKIDLLIGGSPCQSFSFAGKQNGMTVEGGEEILSLERYIELKKGGFQFEGQSYLFWEYVRILKETKPKYFFLENVMMSEKWEKIITKTLGIAPLKINSSLVSAQNRKRLYWTNIGVEKDNFDLFAVSKSIIPQPKDRGILLKHILQNDVDEKYNLSDKMLLCFDRHKIAQKEKGNNFGFNPTKGNKKANSITTRAGSRPDDNYIKIEGCDYRRDEGLRIKKNEKTGSLMARAREDESCGQLVKIERKIITHEIKQMVKVRKYKVEIEKLQKLLKVTKNKTNLSISKELNVKKSTVDHWFRVDNSFSIPDAQIWPKLKKCLSINTDYFDSQIMDFEEKENEFEQSNRVYDSKGLSPTLTATQSDLKIITHSLQPRNGKGKGGKGHLCKNDNKSYCVDTGNGQAIERNTIIRRLTPIECERLQGFKDDYTKGVSDSQRYKMLGNGWQIDTIQHIFEYLKG